MPIIFSFLAAFSVAPFVSFLLAYSGVYSYPFYQIEIHDVVTRAVFISVFWLTLIIFYKKLRLSSWKVPGKKDLDLYFASRKKFYRLLIPLALCAGFVFISTGYEFLVQGVGRGELRTSHGIAGPFYRLTIGFLIPALSCLVACYYFSQERKNFKTRLFFFLYILLLCVAMVSTGYKSTVIFFFGPFAAAYLMHNGGFGKFLAFCFIFTFVIIAATMLVRDIDLYSASLFIINRIFYMSAYGDVGFLSVKDTLEFNPSYFVTNIFGRHVYDLMFDSADRLHYISSNLSLLISYMVYPDVDAVLAGKTNLTVTNYSESIFLFGKAFLIFPLMLGSYVGILCGVLNKLFYRGQWVLFSLLVSYVFSVVLPSMNSGSFLNLFSFFTFVYISLCYLFLWFFVSLCVAPKKLSI